MPVTVRLSNAQVAFFINGLPPNRLRLAADIIEKIPFKPNPLIIPIPDDAPAEAPRLLLESTDNRLRCVLSLTRADFLSSGLQPYSLQAIIDDSLHIARVMANSGIDTGRVGFVSTTLLESEAPSMVHLRRLFESSLVAERAVEVDISSRTLVDVAGEACNCWFRVHSLPKGFTNPTVSQFEAVIDHNTNPEPSRVLSIDSLERFLREAATLQERMLQLLALAGGVHQ